MDDAVVVNASPLIFLSRGGHIKLLTHFAHRVFVPIPVMAEICKKGLDDITVRTIETSSWIETVSTSSIPDVIHDWGLGAGESSVLAYAFLSPGMTAIVDDLAGRKCAASLGIPVRGTLGIVLTAKKMGIIPSARSIIEDLVKTGLYLSPIIMETALSRVGE